MKSVVGVFVNRKDAVRAVERLRSIGIEEENVTLLAPGAAAGEIDDVPVTDTEQPGMGKAVGGVVGAAVGGAAGMHLGTMAATSLLVPGFGPVIGMGIMAGALLAGIFGGAAVGGKLEDTLVSGLPVDELHVYEDALRQGRSVVISLATDEAQAEAVRGMMDRSGAESLDAAREKWWVGLRDAEAETYEAPAGSFQKDEPVFRKGFEAALSRRFRDKDFAAVRSELSADPDVADPAYERGFKRGRAWLARKDERS